MTKKPEKIKQQIEQLQRELEQAEQERIDKNQDRISKAAGRTGLDKLDLTAAEIEHEFRQIMKQKKQEKQDEVASESDSESHDRSPGSDHEQATYSQAADSQHEDEGQNHSDDINGPSAQYRRGIMR